MKTPEQRFWEKVDKSGDCWIWTGGKTDKGYGVFFYDGKTRKAPRVSWYFRFGKIPNSLWVLHKCDNPPCVNPDHLFLGTPGDNVMDMMQKGRWSGGGKLKPFCIENHIKSKIKQSGCLTCRRERNKVWMRQKRKQERAAQ